MVVQFYVVQLMQKDDVQDVERDLREQNVEECPCFRLKAIVRAARQVDLRLTQRDARRQSQILHES